MLATPQRALMGKDLDEREWRVSNTVDVDTRAARQLHRPRRYLAPQIGSEGRKDDRLGCLLFVRTALMRHGRERTGSGKASPWASRGQRYH